MEIFRQTLIALYFCIGISTTASSYELYDPKWLSMLPSQPVSLAIGEITNKCLENLLGEKIIPNLNHFGEKHENFILINTIDTSNGRDRIEITILDGLGVTRFFPDRLESKEISSNEICIIPNEQILIYGFLKEGYKWVKKSGKYTPPLQWEEWEILMINDCQLDIIVDVSEKNIDLVAINRFEGFEQLPNELIRTFFEEIKKEI